MAHEVQGREIQVYCQYTNHSGGAVYTVKVRYYILGNSDVIMATSENESHNTCAQPFWSEPGTSKALVSTFRFSLLYYYVL